jgi:hypothetical protein
MIGNGTTAGSGIRNDRGDYRDGGRGRRDHRGGGESWHGARSFQSGLRCVMAASVLRHPGADAIHRR